MPVGILATLPDVKITTNIAKKYNDIMQLFNKGCTLKLCFTEAKGEYKHAVIKMSP